MKDTDTQIKECVELLQSVFAEDLMGVYLYGSSIVGGLQRFSDLDIFVVTMRPTTTEQKEKLVKNLLSISGIYRSAEKRPIEMTIVVQSDINPWHYPPSFDFQYGDWLREEFVSGNFTPWKTTVNPDLALLITQVKLASRILYGEDASSTLPKVPIKDFMSALVDGLDNLQNDLKDDTRNVLLTLARIWMTIETCSIASKQTAAQWAIEHLPENLKLPIEKASLFAEGVEEETWDDLKDSIPQCAGFMIGKIKEKIKNIDLTESKITIVE